MDRLLLTWEPAGCLRSGFPHIWFSLLDKYTALYWMSHPRVSPHFTGLLCHYSHSTSCFSEVETGSLTADRCFFQLKYCFKKIPVSYDYQSLMIVWNAQEAKNTAQYLRSVYGPTRVSCPPTPSPENFVQSPEQDPSLWSHQLNQHSQNFCSWMNFVRWDGSTTVFIKYLFFRQASWSMLRVQ